MPSNSAASAGRALGAGKCGESGGGTRNLLVEGAVVVTETVTFVVELLGVSGLGVTVQLAAEGAPAQVKLMG
jgi:hypothetical protein